MPGKLSISKSMEADKILLFILFFSQHFTCSVYKFVKGFKPISIFKFIISKLRPPTQTLLYVFSSLFFILSKSVLEN